MTITIGWWLVPLIITLIAFGWCFARDSGGGYANIGGFMDFVAALIVSLVAWLAWSLFR